MTMSAPSPLAILGIGMMTPVGLTASQTAKSVRAGISRIQESPFLDDKLEPFSMGYLQNDLLSPLKQEIANRNNLTSLHRRLLCLGAEALAAAIATTPCIEDVPLFLALPTPFPGRDVPHAADFLGLLAHQSGIPFNQGRSCVFSQGRAGFFHALQEAIHYLQAPDSCGIVLVGGLDSYLDPWILEHYSIVEKRLLREGVADGFRAGEGAAFFMLTTPSACQRHNWTPHAIIQSVGVGMEEGHLYSDKPYRGDGLAGAFASLFAEIEPPPIQTVFAGFNGENIWAKEWGVSLIRQRKHFAEKLRIEHPAECIGDAGAALPAIMLGCVALGLQQGYLPGPALVFASSDGPHRGAALLLRSDAS